MALAQFSGGWFHLLLFSCLELAAKGTYRKITSWQREILTDSLYLIAAGCALLVLLGRSNSAYAPWLRWVVAVNVQPTTITQGSLEWMLRVQPPSHTQNRGCFRLYQVLYCTCMYWTARLVQIGHKVMPTCIRAWCMQLKVGLLRANQ